MGNVVGPLHPFFSSPNIWPIDFHIIFFACMWDGADEWTFPFLAYPHFCCPLLHWLTGRDSDPFLPFSHPFNRFYGQKHFPFCIFYTIIKCLLWLLIFICRECPKVGAISLICIISARDGPAKYDWSFNSELLPANFICIASHSSFLPARGIWTSMERQKGVLVGPLGTFYPGLPLLHRQFPSIAVPCQDWGAENVDGDGGCQPHTLSWP